MYTLGDTEYLKEKVVRYLHDLADKVESGEVVVDRMTIETRNEFFQVQHDEITIKTMRAKP